MLWGEELGDKSMLELAAIIKSYFFDTGKNVYKQQERILQILKSKLCRSQFFLNCTDYLPT